MHSYCTFSVCLWLMLFWSCDHFVSGSLTCDESNNNNTIISSDKKRYEIIIRKSDDRKIRTLKKLHTLITRRTQMNNECFLSAAGAPPPARNATLLAPTTRSSPAFGPGPSATAATFRGSRSASDSATSTPISCISATDGPIRQWPRAARGRCPEPSGG